jgi:multidrug resistance efflux pump
MNDTSEPMILESAEAARVPRIPHAEVNGELRDRVKKLRIGGPNEGGSKGSALGRVAWLPWLLCGILALTWGSVAIRTYKNKPAEGSGGTFTAVSSSSSGSKPSSGGASSGSIQLEQSGYLVAARQISVSPIDVGGKVIELRGPAPLKPGDPPIPFMEGALYQKDEIIAILDAEAYKAQVMEAEASLASAQKRLEAAKYRLEVQLPKSVRKVEVDQVEAELRESEAQYTRAEQELKRQESLGGSVMVKELQQAQADKRASLARVERLKATLIILKEGPRKEQIASAEAEVKGAEADVAAAQARLVQANWRLNNCTIRAPISGTVLTKAAEVGKLVNPMAFSGGGAICDLADLADLEVDLEIPEKDISKLKVGQPCTIRADAFPDKTYQGKLDRIMPIANRAKNIVNARVKVSLPQGEIPGTFLKPEMRAVVSFRGEADEK